MSTGEFIGIAICVVLVLVAVAWGLLLHLRIYKHYHYVCTKCSNSYKPTTFIQSLFGLNGGEQRKLKCPHCNKKEWANMIKNAS